ncbi:peptidoglycan editing factor PgeF [Thalassobacillus devorans]|uniref:peptidoglycan editing factor PgeF n=1 Tax=Thalassobacillus devorans TaxID=279813 RepID=UPI000A1CD3EF|nr:peptidoglycan editing factor PgeF [Thalassobacillus devorans]
MTEPFSHKEDRVFVIEEWMQAQPKLQAGFTSRKGGVSAPPYASFNHGLHVNDKEQDVIANRELLASSTGISLNKWVIGEQVHGTEVAVVKRADGGRGAREQGSSVKNCDGLITNTPGLLLAAFFADCVPLYFHAPNAGWIGIAHAGWKGTVNGMAASMVEALINEGASREDIHATIGPSISKKHYEVDQRVIDNIEDKYIKLVTEPRNDGKFLLDLRELNRLMLVGAGIKEQNIRITEHCTYEQEDVFFSHRRDNGKTGRMLGFIGFTDGKGDV